MRDASVVQADSAAAAADVESIRKRVAVLPWMQRIDLGNGIVTPGKWENPLIRSAFDRIDFRGKRVLDVGTCNGKWAFEAEHRGAAEVVAIDNIGHVEYCYRDAFECAREILGSRVSYDPDTDVCEFETDEPFDVVIFCGVYYHLRDPLRALTKLRASIREGGVMVVEGPAYDDASRAFATFHYRDRFLGDRSNWWVPSRRALEEWIESTFFEIEACFTDAVEAGLLRRVRDAVRTRVLGRSPYARRFVYLCRAVTREDRDWPPPYRPFDAWMT